MNDEEDIMKKLQKVANRDCNFCWQKGENCDGDECEKVIAKKILNIYNRQQAEIDDLKRDTVPKLQDSLERANKYGKQSDEENSRLKAEIERLNGNLFTISNACMQRRNEAIKEFAERLKENQRTFIGDEYAYGFIPSIEIDVLLTEMGYVEKMREILFRGKRKDNGEWVYGYYCKYGYTGKEKHCIFPFYASDLYAIEVIPETVGQFTGFTDKNGKKIFEGDIVKIKDYSKGCALNYEQPTSNWVVKWNDKHAQFTIDYMALLPYKHFDESEVIGNIHDNPEILKGE